MSEKLLTEEIKDIAHRMITASSDHALSRPEFEGYLKAILAKTASTVRVREMAYFHGQLKHYLETVPRENMWDEISGFVMSSEGELEALKRGENVRKEKTESR